MEARAKLSTLRLEASMPNNHSHYYSQRGVSLLEVLVAILVLSFGLLGIAALQANALKNNESSFQRTQAVMLTSFIIDTMRLDRANLASYVMSKTCTPPTASGSIVAESKSKWLTTIQTNLGSTACGEISLSGTTYSVKIYWDDGKGTGGDTSQFLETKTRF